MHTDISLHAEDGSFKLRVCPVLYIKDRFLVTSRELTFFAFPGGHTELGETTEEK
ncbi:MAG: hypothetical protein LBN07_00750 [Christensenellaceae bacterium]|jgi:8-oxo-dGTP pyrophosphatase MutT (NUDIX family)|nr:hypothetical protein [Christensenellaceae bacterium]